MDYIQHLERLNIEIASEFILVAATLMRGIKQNVVASKRIGRVGNEIDPQEELVQALMDYKTI